MAWLKACGTFLLGLAGIAVAIGVGSALALLSTLVSLFMVGTGIIGLGVILVKEWQDHRKHQDRDADS